MKSTEIDAMTMNGYDQPKLRLLQEIAFQLAVGNEREEIKNGLMSGLISMDQAKIADHQWNAETIKQTPTKTLHELCKAVLCELAERNGGSIRAILASLVLDSQTEIESVGAAVRDAMDNSERPTRLHLTALLQALRKVYGDFVDSWEITENPVTSRLLVAIPHQQLVGNEGTFHSFFHDCNLIPKGWTVQILNQTAVPTTAPVNSWADAIEKNLKQVWGGSGFDYLDYSPGLRTITIYVNQYFQTGHLDSIRSFVDNLKPHGWMVEVKYKGDLI